MALKVTMLPRIPTLRAALLACAALTCGPKPAGTDTNATATDTSDGDTLAGPTEPTGGPAEWDACALVPDPGDCEGAVDRYFFDPATQQCQVFSWGGCGGVVPFTDLVECQNACDPCEAFFVVDEPLPLFPPVEITIRNRTTAPIFLRTFTWDQKSAFREELFELWSADGTAPLSTAPNACDFACGEWEHYNCKFLCTDAGPPSNPRMIIPGGAVKTQWGGQYMAEVEVPTRCLPAQCDSLACGRWLDATPGMYEIRVAGAESWMCFDPDCCAPNESGWCDLLGPSEYYAGDPYILELVAPFTFPGGPVELAFQ